MRRLLPALLLLATALTPAAANATPGANYVGANTQPLFEKNIVPPERWDSYAARMSADGLRIARLDAIWQWAEPDPPVGGVHTYRWDREGSSLDDVVALFARHGVRIAAVLALAPGWAGNASVELTPEHYADYAAFAGAFAARYGANGTFWNEHPELPRTPIRDYQVWTEANSTNFFTRRPDPVEYLKVIRLVAPAVRAADPGTPVLVDIGWQNFEEYVRALYDGGIKGLIDGIGFNPYAPHAPAIIELVRRMRALLVARGDGALPIHILEIGQPINPAGGASSAGTDRVSDTARAATQSLAADVLARSDCGVEDYLLYSVVGSETELEPIGEGFMGIYGIADAAPNATGRAMADVAARWRAAPGSGLRLCGGGATPAAAQLPLDATVSPDGGRCVAADVRYRGNPLEGARLRLEAGSSNAEGESNAFGKARACLPSGASSQATAVVTMSGVARSASYTCAFDTSRCSVTSDAPGDPAPCACETPPAGTPPATTTPPTTTPAATTPPSGTQKPCGHRLTVRLTRVTRKSARASANVTCGTAVRPRLRVRVYVRRRNGRLTRRVRTVTLTYRKTTAFTVKARLRPGERLVLAAGPDRARGVPALKTTALATRRLGAR